MATKALSQIRDADAVDMALDPEWAARVAVAILAEIEADMPKKAAK
jgi:hypothetical protein